MPHLLWWWRWTWWERQNSSFLRERWIESRNHSPWYFQFHWPCWMATLHYHCLCVYHSPWCGLQTQMLALYTPVLCAIHNCLPHSNRGDLAYTICACKRFQSSPFQVFGCHIFALPKADHDVKLDIHAHSGIFLGHYNSLFSAEKLDIATGKIKTARLDEVLLQVLTIKNLNRIYCDSLTFL